MPGPRSRMDGQGAAASERDRLVSWSLIFDHSQS